MNGCLIIRGKKITDEKMRPGSIDPEKHWSYHLLGAWSTYDADTNRVVYPEGASIVWNTTQQDPIQVVIQPSLWKDNEALFKHLMAFVKDNDLTYEFPDQMNKCAHCEGHPACLANQHKVDSKP